MEKTKIKRNHIDWTEDKIQFLINKYVSKEMNTIQLAKYFGCSDDTIGRRLKENNIIPKKFYEDLTGKNFGKLHVLGKSKKSKRKLYWDCQCECGKIISICGDVLRQGKQLSCGCLKSKGELVINKLLIENNINFVTQYSFSDLKSEYNNIKYRFDFAILDKNNNLKYLIEYDGEQHFKQNINNSGWNTEKEFLKIQKRDYIKNQYCINHNIPLIRISYQNLNDIKIEDLLLEFSNYRII